MTSKEARQIVQEFDTSVTRPTEEEIFVFTEAMDYLINKEHNPEDMVHLGSVYYEMKYFDLSLRYFEMAASYHYDKAYECLGYIWYYGRTGNRDFKKAFEYFSRLRDNGDPVGTYKIADMYKNGYYVDQDSDMYKQMIEELYPRMLSCRNVFDPVPEVFTRLARIRSEEGNVEAAVELYCKAKDWMVQRIQYDPFFGNLNIMKWLIDDLYEIIDFDEECFDFYDLYYLMKATHAVSFLYEDKIRCLVFDFKEGENSVWFEGKWFRSRNDFFQNAEIEGIKLTAIADELYAFKLEDCFLEDWRRIYG